MNRFLEKNKVSGTENIRFEEEGHKYWARSKYYDEWVSTKSGCGASPLISTTTILGEYFVTDMDKIANDIWNNPKFRLLMETDPKYKYYGCKCIDDIKNIWSKGATEGTKMHEHFEDMVNLIEYDKEKLGDKLKDDPIISITTSQELSKKVKKEDMLIQAVASRMEHDGDEGIYREWYEKISSIRNYNFNMRKDTECYKNVKEKLDGYFEKMYLFMFLEKFKLTDPNSGINFYRTELLMWHDVLHFSGMIDALLYDKRRDGYIIVDWKRCKNGIKWDPNPNNPRTKPVHMLAPSGRGRGLPAFKMLRNHNGNKYGCQLTLYKHMFEHMTGKKIIGLYIVAVDSNKLGRANALQIHEIPLTKYDECIKQVFIKRARDMLARYENTLDDDHMDELIKMLPDDDDPGSPIPEEEFVDDPPMPLKRKLEEEETNTDNVKKVKNN
jgi:hypothetical protein